MLNVQIALSWTDTELSQTNYHTYIYYTVPNNDVSIADVTATHNSNFLFHLTLHKTLHLAGGGTGGIQHR